MSASPARRLRDYREANPGIQMLAHPECPPDVIAEADYTGSTSKMTNWVLKNRPATVLLVTECSMASNIAAEAPDIEFIRPCNLCPHMKRITLPKILDSLVELQRRGDGRPDGRRQGAPRGRADGQPEELTTCRSARGLLRKSAACAFAKPRARR